MSIIGVVDLGLCIGVGDLAGVEAIVGISSVVVGLCAGGSGGPGVAVGIVGVIVSARVSVAGKKAGSVEP